MNRRFPDLDLVLIESGGDNLAATFSPELADLTIYVIDVAGRRQDPAQGRPRHHPLATCWSSTRPTWRRMVGASLEVMDRDARKMRGERPFVFTNLKEGRGVAEVRELRRDERRARGSGADALALGIVERLELEHRRHPLPRHLDLETALGQPIARDAALWPT